MEGRNRVGQSRAVRDGDDDASDGRGWPCGTKANEGSGQKAGLRIARDDPATGRTVGPGARNRAKIPDTTGRAIDRRTICLYGYL